MHIMKRINSLIEYIIIFLMLIAEITVIGVNPEIAAIIKNLFYFFLLIYTVYSVKKIIVHKKYFKRTVLIFISAEIYNFIFLLINKTNSKLYIIYFIFILGCFIFITANYSLDTECFYKMLTKLSNIIFILTILSLILYFLGSIANIIKPTGVKELYWNVDIVGSVKYINSYFNLLYEPQSTIINGISIPRNSSIYTEATLYCIFLNIAFGVELFIKEKLNRFKIVTLVIATFTTFSTTGIVVMISIILAKVIIASPSKKVLKILKLLILPIIICFLIISTTMIIYNKINNTSIKSYSFRMDDFKMGIYTWEENDMVSGTGFKNLETFRSNLDTNVRGGDIGGSIGIMNILFQGGLYLITLYVIVFARLIYYSVKYRNCKVFIITYIFLIQLILNPIQYRYILLCLLAFGLNYNPKYELEKSKRI